MPPEPVRPPWWRRAILTVLGIAVFGATAELATRRLRPSPRVQVIDLETQPVRWIENHPLVEHGPQVTTDPPCPRPGGRSVLVMGDSIAVLGATPDATIGPQLASLLRAAWGVPTCAWVAARPGLPVEGQFAFARHLDPKGLADVLVVLLWRGRGAAVRTDRYWIETTGIHTDGVGLPAPPFPLPSALHRFGIDHSHAWRLLTLALARTQDADPGTALETHRAIVRWAHDRDMPVVFALMPPLDRPFGAPWGQTVWKRDLHDAVQGDPSIRWLDVGGALGDAGIDVRDARMDTCCHYLPAGHAAVAKALVPTVLDLVPPPETTP